MKMGNLNKNYNFHLQVILGKLTVSCDIDPFAPKKRVKTYKILSRFHQQMVKKWVEWIETIMIKMNNM